MAIREINYLKQSEDNNYFVLLNSYNIKITADYSKIINEKARKSYSSTVFEKNAFPVNLRIFGQSYHSKYDQFSSICCTKPDIAKDVESPPFPVAIRAIKNNTYVIERPPFKTNVRLSVKRAYQSKKLDESDILCEIWIPWTVSILNLKNEHNNGPSMKMYYNDGPLSSFDEVLSPSWTPNFHHHGEVCLGGTSLAFNQEVMYNNLNPDNVQEVYNYLINDYFNGGWNMDLGPGIVQHLCNRNIGKFTRNPLGNSELALRAKDSKVKIKTIDGSSRQASLTRAYYFNWSLLTLAEVLNAVKIYKNDLSDYDFRSYKLDSILESADQNISDEHEACCILAQEMYANNNKTSHWEIHLIISSEIINKIVHKKYSLSDLKDYSVLQFGSLCSSIAYNLVLVNHGNILPLINNALNSIADNYLNSKFENHMDIVRVEYSDDSVSLEKEKVHL